MSAAAPARPEERLARRGGAVELLRLPAALFGLVVRLRGWLYDQGLLPVGRLEVPVICVGNLTAGGTGKTPFAAWLARELDRRGLRVGLLSRGYGAREGANDEARLLERLLPEVPHVQDPDRLAGGRELVARGVDAVILDDGFQHRRLARDLDLVLVDATRPWGLAPAGDGGPAVCALLPRGLLRESPSALARADAIVLTRCDQVTPGHLEELSEQLLELAPGRPILRAAHRPRALRSATGEQRLPSALRGVQVDLLSAIGNPQAFERSVADLGARVHQHRRFPDHHEYRPGDLEGLGADGRLVVTTAKDLVKLEGFAPAPFALDVELELREGGPVLEALLDSLPTGRARRERASLHEGLHG